jgi:hypothetical protein
MLKTKNKNMTELSFLMVSCKITVLTVCILIKFVCFVIALNKFELILPILRHPCQT